MRLHDNIVGSGCYLSDDRSHKVQYTDLIIGHLYINFVSIDDP